MLIRREISATFADAKPLLDEIHKHAEEQGLLADDLFKARLEIEGALIRAITRHLNSAAPHRLRVAADITPAGVRMTVSDID